MRNVCIVGLVVLSLLLSQTASAQTPTGTNEWEFIAGDFKVDLPTSWWGWDYEGTDASYQPLVQYLSETFGISQAEAWTAIKPQTPWMMFMGFDANLANVSVMFFTYEGLELSEDTPMWLVGNTITTLDFETTSVYGADAAYTYYHNDISGTDMLYLVEGFESVAMLVAVEAMPEYWQAHNDALKAIALSVRLAEEQPETDLSLLPDMPGFNPLPQLPQQQATQLPNQGRPAGDPIYGFFPDEVTPSSASVSEPFRLQMTAGGEINMTTHGCVGYATEAPTYAFRVAAGLNVALVFFSDNNQDTAITLLTPSGQFECVDDSTTDDGQTLVHPFVGISSTEAGTYYVWVSVKQPNSLVSGSLFIVSE